MYKQKIKIQAKRLSETVITTSFLVLVSFLFTVNTNAQCAMCRAAIESEGNGVKAEAVNDGIIYLMVIPYVLVAGIGFAVYKMNKK